MPRPEMTTNTTTIQYCGASAAIAIPIPAMATPTGRSQIAPRASDHSPKSGWTIDDDSVDARTGLRRACTRGGTRSSGTGAEQAARRPRNRRTRDRSRAASSHACRSARARSQRIGIASPRHGDRRQRRETSKPTLRRSRSSTPSEGLPDLDPRLAELVEWGEIKGSAGATCVLHGDRGRIVAAGGGRRDELDADSIRDAAGGVARLGLGGTVAWLLDERARG